MKKRIQSIVSCVLVLVMVGMVFSDVIPVNAAITSTTKEEVLFEDDFSYSDSDTNATKLTNMRALGWDNAYLNQTRAGYAASGVYTVPADKEIFLLTLGNADALNWSEYTVEADVKLPEISATNSNTNAYLVLNADTNNAGGYEFGIQCLASGESNLVFRRYKKDGSYTTLTYKTEGYTFEANTDYTLKLTYSNGILYGHCDDQLVASYDTSQDDVMITKGAAGIRKYGTGLSVVYDNFKVSSVKKDVLLSEDFGYNSLSDLSPAGWNYASEDGVAIIDGALETDFSVHNTITANSVNGVAAWNDYTVEADVVVVPGSVGSGTACVGILGRTELDGTGGYELCLVLNGTSVVARVRELADNKRLVDNTTIISSITETTTFHLKMHFYGNRISCYVDNTLVCTATDSTYTSGAAGIKIIKPSTLGEENPITAKVNDFQVTTWEEDVVETLSDQEGADIKVSNSNQVTTTIFSETENSGEEYSIEVDVTIDPTYVPSSGVASAGIICRCSSDKKSYYIFELTLNTSKQVKARKRVISEASTIKEYTVSANAIETLGTDTKTYHLKVTTTSNSINFYVDGELQLTITLSDLTGTDYAYTSGMLGTVALTSKNVTKCPFSFTNFKVLSTTDTSSSLLGDVDADAIISNADLNNLNQQLWEGTSENADVNVDASTDAADLVRLIKIIEYYDFEYKLY